MTFTFDCILSISSLKESLHPITAHLLAAYTLIFGLLTIPAAEAIFTICPCLAAIIPGNNALVICISALQLIIMVRSISSCVWSVKNFPTTIPALLINISIPPISVFKRFAASSTASVCITFTTACFTVYPRVLNSSTVCNNIVSFISQITRVPNPFSSSILPIIFPIPEAPPVISAFLCSIWLIADFG